MLNSSVRPFILLSNDDGYQAPGLNFLIDVLRPIADIMVVAPSGARSGLAVPSPPRSPFSADSCMRKMDSTFIPAREVRWTVWKLAFNVLLDNYNRKPDLVVSGVNHGDNSSVNTFLFRHHGSS